MEEAELARELKVFRKQFKRDHGRDPSRKDMNKHPGIAAIYDAWLAIKSSQSASTSKIAPSTSASSSKALKRKPPPSSPQDVTSGREERGDGEKEGIAMGPPPTTPSKKKKKVTYQESFLTPTKRTGSSMSPGQSVHDSGGSIVDVPLTPKQHSGSPSLDRRHHQEQTDQSRWSSTAPTASASWRAYEDATSPSKLRALLSSFSTIHKTPTKTRDGEEKSEDAVLMEKLSQGGGGKAYPAYTPRTKARKRLRGEVVVTPEKVKEGRLGSGLPREGEHKLPKKRRGMAATTLTDYGIVPVAGPRSNKGASHLSKGEEKEYLIRSRTSSADAQRMELVDEDDEDEILGPSPSVNRMVDRQIKTFRPLFGVEADGTISENEENGSEAIAKTEETPGAQEDTPGTTSKAINSRNPDADSGDDEVIVKPYQRFERSRRGRLSVQPTDEEDDDDGAGGFYGMGWDRGIDDDEATGVVSSEDEDGPPVMDSLSLHSPQCKKARQSMRLKAEKKVRQLLGAEEEIQELDIDEEAGTEAKQAPPRTNKVGPPIKGGKLRKGFRDVKSEVGSGKTKKEVASKIKPASLVFQNTRDQIGSDQDSDVGQGDEGDDRDDDEWASDVSSAEYGLGDGYMSDDVDVM